MHKRSSRGDQPVACDVRRALIFGITYRRCGHVDDDVDEQNDFLFVGAEARSAETTGGHVEWHYVTWNQHFVTAFTSGQGSQKQTLFRPNISYSRYETTLDITINKLFNKNIFNVCCSITISNNHSQLSILKHSADYYYGLKIFDDHRHVNGGWLLIRIPIICRQFTSLLHTRTVANFIVAECARGYYLTAISILHYRWLVQ